MSTESKQTALDYIDALRGYAILMVMAVHSSQYFSELPYITQKLADQGARGVQLFFVVSALTLCMSWQARDDGALPFYIRRLFRIAPMFWLSIPLYLSLNGFGPSIYAPDGIGVRQIIMAATFTHGLAPDAITSVVPGSWSIADEMMFYAIFPLLVAALNRLSFSAAAVITVLATLLLYWVHQLISYHASLLADPASRDALKMFTYLWLPQQLPCFLFGMLVFKWTAEGGLVPWPRLLVALSLAGMVIIAFKALPVVSRLSMPVQYGALFAMFALGMSRWSPVALVNPIICWIGKVSFSAYLIHFAVIKEMTPQPAYAATFAMVATITIALSSATYLIIEQPFIALGRRTAKLLVATEKTKAGPDDRHSLAPIQKQI